VAAHCGLGRRIAATEAARHLALRRLALLGERLALLVLLLAPVLLTRVLALLLATVLRVRLAGLLTAVRLLVLLAARLTGVLLLTRLTRLLGLAGLLGLLAWLAVLRELLLLWRTVAGRLT
jgi:hypothetical protein